MGLSMGLLVTCASISRMMAAACTANVTTTRWLADRPSAEPNIVTISVRSSAAHSKASVSGLPAVTASKPSPHTPSVIESVLVRRKSARTVAVNNVASASVTRLSAYTQENWSPMSDGCAG